MYGVVLWSDTRERKAVIWCEDHGDLAYYRRGEQGNDVCLDQGDWVQFDLAQDRQQRLANNPRLISGRAYEDLPRRLNSAAADEKPRRTEAAPPPSAEIISFAPARKTGAGESPVYGPFLNRA